MAEARSLRSPLVRSGLTQAGRRRAELGPGHFRIDERDVADLILFGRRLARHIRFYEAPRKGVSANALLDWTAFFDSDISASLAALAKLPVEPVIAFQSDLAAWLKADPARDPAVLGAYFKLAFHLPLALLGELGAIAGKLPGSDPLRASAAELARRDLAQPIEAIIGWYKGAVAPGPLQLFADEAVAAPDYKLGPVASDPRLRLPSRIQSLLVGRKPPANEPLPAILLEGAAPGSWEGLWNGVQADDAPYRDGGPKAYERIYDAVEYNLMVSAVRTINRAAARLKREAEGQLANSLERFGRHEPHYGLWLAFLRLFRHAQQSLNGFTQRHLDFYFREVLQLRARPAVPDRVHLLFELAKGVEAVRIPAGTGLRAGNDALGRPVRYELEQDLIVNRGRVAARYGLRFDAGPDGTSARASSELRSADGLGKAPLPPDRPHWPAFGPPAAPHARIGFALADRKLFLREGERSIRLLAEFARRLPMVPASDAWRVRLTGPEGWWEAQGSLSVTLDQELDGPRFAKLDHDAAYRRWARGARVRPRLEFRLDLGAEEPPVVPFDPKLHGPGESADGLPRMELTFDFARDSAAAAFESLRNARLLKLELETEAKGLKQLSLVAGGASVDPAKPFAPFGPHPRAGAALVIGSSEIFSKPLADLTLTLDWQEEYATGHYYGSRPAAGYQAEEAILKAGRWQAASASRHPLFGSGRSVSFSFRSVALVDGAGPLAADNPELGAASVSGFARLSLGSDFGHAGYPAAYARALVQMAKGEPDGGTGPILLQNIARQVRHGPWILAQGGGTGAELPPPPYDPVVTRIEASYRSALGPAARFIHLLPFGEADAEPRAGQLLPAFGFAAAMLVGIADFAPPARLSLLVQVADGSGDPLKRPPRLGFAYLSGNEWKPFDDRSVDDKTANFTSSGLLGLALPADADREHRAMPSGLSWVRISVEEDADALNALLSIDAQAGRAMFVDAGNDPAFLATPLAAGTIAKLVRPDPKVKKVIQPYSSFGGRAAEAPEEFATRVSERLRHKDRAVAAFDYEALVLEAFPKLYRAKCLPTTAMVRDDTGRIVADHEATPGAVTVVTVPWTHGVNSRDPLRPYADQALIAEVERFLRRRVSPFVRLEVQNPRFEEVQAAFKVRFHAGIADIAFHRELLNAALVEFLTPWAREGGGDILFGGRLWKSALIDFVEERPEVDFVTDFQLYHKPDADAPEGDWTPVDVELVEATSARSILVSAPRHRIEEVGRRA